MGLYVHGSCIGVEDKGKKDKPMKIIHVLDGYEKTEIISNSENCDVSEGDSVEIPVNPYVDKFGRLKFYENNH